MTRSKDTDYELEKLSSKSLVKWNERSRKIKEYVYQNYMYFAQKRSEIMSDLISSLCYTSDAYSFRNWQRIVSWKYSLKPLSAIGSINNPVGGRFNIGGINPTIFPKNFEKSKAYIEVDRSQAPEDMSSDVIRLDNSNCYSFL